MYSYLNTRMNRQTYWTILIPVVVLVALAVAFLPRSPGILEIVMISIGVPRLHDLGRSGWWMAVPFGVEIAGIAGGLALGGVEGILIGGGLAVIVIFLMMVVLGLLPGQAEANAYGPPQAGFSAWKKAQAT